MKLAAYDPAGQYLAAIDESAAQRALDRREAVRLDDRSIQLRPSAAAGIRELTPEEKRRQHLARERARR